MTELYLTHLSLSDFRNFTRLDVDVPQGAILLVGPNAQGKTSLLEAIYFLATLTSFHASQDRQLISFLAAREGLAVARINAAFQRGEKNHRLEVRVIQETNGFSGAPKLRKEVILDGMKLKASEAVGRFTAVLFLPQMLAVIDGSPEERRRYLNLALAQVLPRYPLALAEYSRALSQRNALLKQLGERGGDSDQLEFWDEKLASSGAVLIHARIHAVHQLERLAARLHRELTRNQNALRLAYQPAYDPLPQRPGQISLGLDTAINRSGFTLEQIEQGFLRDLSLRRSEEIARGVTTIGPHRDEFRVLENGIDLGTYGSRGQVRTAVLALKLAEALWMREKTGYWPVVLLDEVLAELDAERRADLLERLQLSEQILLTTTDLDLFSPEFVQKATLWHIEGGRVTAHSQI